MSQCFTGWVSSLTVHTQYCLFCYHHCLHTLQVCFLRRTFVTTSIVLINSRNGEPLIAQDWRPWLGVFTPDWGSGWPVFNALTPSSCQALAPTRTNIRAPAPAPADAALSRPAPGCHAPSLERDTVRLKTKSSCGSWLRAEPATETRRGPLGKNRFYTHRRGLYNSSDCLKS